MLNAGQPGKWVSNPTKHLSVGLILGMWVAPLTSMGLLYASALLGHGLREQNLARRIDKRLGYCANVEREEKANMEKNN